MSCTLEQHASRYLGQGEANLKDPSGVNAPLLQTEEYSDVFSSEPNQIKMDTALRRVFFGQKRLGLC